VIVEKEGESNATLPTHLALEVAKGSCPSLSSNIPGRAFLCVPFPHGLEKSQIILVEDSSPYLPGHLPHEWGGGTIPGEPLDL